MSDRKYGIDDAKNIVQTKEKKKKDNCDPPFLANKYHKWMGTMHIRRDMDECKD